nr:zinc ribbon domain-containing protein [candidate division Zixibacteria bacterium]
MPMYEYTCLDCSEKFEELVSSSTVTVTCPHCQSQNTVKQFSTFASNALKSNSSCGTCKPTSGFS